MNMKFSKAVILMLLTSLMIACNQHTEHKQEHTKVADTDSHKESNHELSLNNGNRWKANAETTTVVNNMITLMNNFSDTENTTAYLSLKDSLEVEFNLIFKNCTMKGEAHNQLHNFLLPTKEMFQGLKSSNLDSCKQRYDGLNEHLAKYANYFE